MGYRVNPSMRAKLSAQLVPRGNTGNFNVKCLEDLAEESTRRRQNAVFPCRSGITALQVVRSAKGTWLVTRSKDASRTKYESLCS